MLAALLAHLSDAHDRRAERTRDLDMVTPRDMRADIGAGQALRQFDAHDRVQPAFPGDVKLERQRLDAYRIALLRRHMGMDTIIPYVLWVALLLFLVDFSMNKLNHKLHPWFEER